MSDKNLSKEQIQKLSDRYFRINFFGCIIAVAGIMFIPSVPLIAVVSGIGVGIGYIALKKQEKLDEKKKNL